eukprot:6059829-Ditylum_brightwellii.AAC.1
MTRTPIGCAAIWIYSVIYNKAQESVYPHKTLGHYKAPAGANKIQKEAQGDKSDDYAVKLQTSVLTHLESWRYYDSCYLKLVGYVLGQCFFKKKDLQEIEKEALHAFVSKLGCNRNIAKEIQEGPFDFGGSLFTTLSNI